jgi:drug/metabolite transporter (DMT)-like permease
MTVLWDTIGISIQLVSTFLAALAYVLQKKAHIRVSAGGIESWSDPANRKALVLWRGGFALMVVCALLDLSTYPMLDLSKQAPLGAATLVFNSILASILLAEPFTVLDLLSTVLIFAGTITAVINSEAESATFTFPEIIGLLDDGIVKAYSAVVIPGLLGAAFFIERVSRTNPGDWSPSQRRAMALLSPASGGMFMGFTGYTAKCLSTVVAGQEWDQVRREVLLLGAGQGGACAVLHWVVPDCAVLASAGLSLARPQVH